MWCPNAIKVGFQTYHQIVPFFMTSAMFLPRRNTWPAMKIPEVTCSSEDIISPRMEARLSNPPRPTNIDPNCRIKTENWNIKWLLFIFNFFWGFFGFFGSYITFMANITFICIPVQPTLALLFDCIRVSRTYLSFGSLYQLTQIPILIPNMITGCKSPPDNIILYFHIFTFLDLVWLHGTCC